MADSFLPLIWQSFPSVGGLFFLFGKLLKFFFGYKAPHAVIRYKPQIVSTHYIFNFVFLNLLFYFLFMVEVKAYGVIDLSQVKVRIVAKDILRRMTRFYQSSNQANRNSCPFDSGHSSAYAGNAHNVGMFRFKSGCMLTLHKC